MPASPARLAFVLALAFAVAWSNRAAAQDVVLSEILAVNDSALLDEDGDSSDWIELENRESFAVDLEGWSFTDDPERPRRWRFPAVRLGLGERIVVFASGKDRAVPGSELHASFQLDGGGEYAGLLRPDGTVASEYAPEYPEQRPDISYGIAQAGHLTRLVRESSQARIHVPSSGAAGLDWTFPDFDDSGWLAGEAAVGYDVDAAPPPPGGGANVAPEGVASQSSTGFGFGPELANDLDFGNFTHTAAGANLPATWLLDLGREAAIGSIVLHNRASCCRSRLRDITVSILDAPGGAVLFESDVLNPENVLGGGGTDGLEELALDLAELAGRAVRGRVVRVVRTPDPDLSGTGGQGNADEPDVLSLAEVEVFAVPESGYHPFIRTDLAAAMHGVQASTYIRVPFDLADVPAFERLVLRIRYDDGAVAYLNGREVARRNAPASLEWDSAASAIRPDEEAVVFEEIDITAHEDALVAGRNVLAVHGLNASASSSDFLIAVELHGESESQSRSVYFRTPTPGAPNSGESFLGFVDDTTFSADRGFYMEPFDVEIASATDGAEIRYTLDGTRPTLENGTLYAGPIRIDRTATLRAAAYKEGYEPTNADTHTYVFLDDVVLQDHAATLAAGFPPSWGGTAPDYGMDPDVVGEGGRDRYGGKYAATIRDDLLSIPTLSIVTDIDGMFGPSGIYTNSTARGIAWERACSAELIHPDGRSGFQIDCGIRIQGGAFRNHSLTKKHSLRLLFTRRHGPAKLAYPLFGNDAPEEFDTLTLRANSNDGWQWRDAGSQPLYIRDSFGRETVLDMMGVASHEVFVHVYINGIYWGLYNPIERPDHSFSATYFGGEKEDWDAISNGQATNGSFQAWNAMLSLARSGLGNLATYQRIQGRNPDGSLNPAYPAYIDVTNIADYMIVNLYAGNTDWPHKNYWVGFHRAEPSGFKFYMWDSEWSMGIRSSLGTNQTNVGNGVAEPYALLRASEEFRVAFGDSVHRHFSIGGALYVDPERPAWDPEHPERNRPAARFAELAARIDRAIVAESARWGDQHEATPYTRDEHWERERDNLLQGYFPRRSQVVLNQFRAAGLYPNVEAPSFNQHGGFIDPGFALIPRAPRGTIYYTLDGEDPRLPGGAVSPRALVGGSTEDTVLLASPAPVRVHVPADGSLGLEWTAPDFDDSGWISGETGVGFDSPGGSYEALIRTGVGPLMEDINATVYMRLEFEVGDPDEIDFLTLRMQYDDGFVAYLNGTAIAASRAPAEPRWDSRATTSHADSLAVVFEDFDVTSSRSALRRGRNVLALHGLNSSPGSNDLLFAAEVVGSRLLGGGIVLEPPVRVRARALADGEWSALNEALFVADTPVRITELMYHPAPLGDGSEGSGGDLEFVELQNVGDERVSLDGLSLLGGIRFEFSGGAVASLEPGEVVVVVRDLDAFSTRYDVGSILVAGEYDGRLDNLGEDLRLEGPSGERLLDFEYDDAWYPVTDGVGPSLTFVDPRAPREAWRDPGSWRASEEPFGSPGFAGLGPQPGGLQVPGDATQDAHLDLSDAVALLGHLFLGTPAVLPCGEGDVQDPGNRALYDWNGDGGIDLTDPVSLLLHLFRGGSPHVLGTECVPLRGCPRACSGD